MFNKNVLNTQESLIRKYSNEVLKYSDGISLAIGEPAFDVDSKIINKTKEALDNKLTKYTKAQGDNELIEAICLKEQVDKGNVLITQGSSEGIFISLLSILNKDDEVIIITPCYPQYAPVVNFCSGRVIYVDTLNTNYIPTEENIKKVITHKTKAIIINSPSNPTGITYDYNTLKMINELAIKHNFFILCDDVYESLSFKKTHVFKFNLSNTIYLKSFSKTYGMTGFRLGYIITNNNTLKQLLKVHSYLCISSPVFTQKAAVEALSISNFNYDFIKENLIILKQFLIKENIDFINSEAGIFLFINISKFNISSIEFCDKLLDEYHVACVPGNCFLAPDFIRINFAVKKENLIEALIRIKQFINK